MTDKVYAIEVTAYDSTLPGTRTLTFATGTGFCTRPTDAPANTHFRPCVVEAGNFGQFLVDAQVTDGRSRVGTGEIVLANPDGALDAVLDYGLDGRSVVVRRGQPGDAYPAAWTTVFTGTMEQPELTWESIRLLIRDRQAEVADKVYQATKYAGTNAGAPLTGVEGVAGDLQGKPKPVLRGKALNFAPPLVNSSKLTFQVDHKQVQSIDAVYVGGVAIAAGTAHASLALLQAASTAASTYDYYLGGAADGAYFRLGTAPDNVVTCDATQGATAAARTAAQIANQLLLDAGIAPADITASSVAALDLLNSSVLGLWTGTEENSFGAALDAVLSSVGGFWAVDATGKFYLGRLAAPSGTPVRTLEKYELLAGADPVERLKARSADRGIPSWRVALNYQRNYTPQQGGDVFAAVSQARRGFLAEEWRTVVSEDAAVKTKYLLAPQRQVFSLIDAAADAAAEADRVRDLYKVRRDFLRVRVATAQLDGTPVKLGDVWALKVAGRYDWGGAGKKLVLTGATNDYSANETILELWG